MDSQEISILANQGVIFVGTSLGMTRSDWSEWQHKGTDNIAKLKEWVDSGYGLVAVATHGHQFMIDKDDPAACKAMGMPEPFLIETYTVDTPSGGEHQYGLHDAVTESLGNLVVVYAEPGHPKSKKILELKLDGANSVAAPTTVRSGQPGKCDGVYKPRDQKKLAKGLNPEFVEWLRKYGTFVGAPKGKGAAGPARKFHPTFELDDHLEYNKAGEAFSYNKDGALHVVSNTCPLNDGPHRSGDEKQHVRDRVTEFIYGRNGWGFSCVVCNVFTKAEFEQKMLELDPEWEPYPYFVYEDEDDELVLKAFDAEPVSDDISEPVPDYMDVGDIGDIKCTDMGNGKRLARLCGHEIAYCRERGVWFVWNGRIWTEDKGNIDITRKAKSVAKTILIEAAQEPDEAKSDALVNWAMQSQSKTRIEAMIAMSKSEGTVAKSIHDFDKQEHLFNCDNGVIDLRTGELLPHDPKYMMTQITRFKYLGLNANIADAKDFWKFLCWSQPEEAIRLFLQRAFGYSMWGTSREAAVIFLWGDGNNGKGILLNVLDVILGDYSTPAEFKTFSEMGKIGGGGGHGGHSDDLAGLHKKRAASVDETNKGGRFNEGLLKTVTGGSKTMRVSRKGEKGFDMIPMFTFWFASNHKPKLTDTGKSMRRRIKLVKFLNSVEIGKEDTGLTDRIIANEGDILLSWMVQGAVEWHKRGLDTPPSVQEWTSEYFHDEDILQHWLNECTEQGANFESRSSESYLSFAKFSESNGYFKIDQREFKKRLEQKGFIHKSKNYANVYLGFKVTQHFLEEEPKFTADMVDAVM